MTLGRWKGGSKRPSRTGSVELAAAQIAGNLDGGGGALAAYSPEKDNILLNGSKRDLESSSGKKFSPMRRSTKLSTGMVRNKVRVCLHSKRGTE